jgi:hypothetical protein
MNGVVRHIISAKMHLVWGVGGEGVALRVELQARQKKAVLFGVSPFRF